jgi:hypothetical protein
LPTEIGALEKIEKIEKKLAPDRSAPTPYNAIMSPWQ